MSSQKPAVVFSPFRCNICTSVEESRKNQLCSGCMLVSYCGEEHQKIHYRIHRKICIVIRKIYNREKIQHMLEWKKPIRNRSALNETVHSFKLMVILEKGAPLKSEEEMMLNFPRCCEVCFEYSTRKLRNCEDCGFVAYCSKEHEMFDKERHSKVCKNFKFFYNFVKIDHLDPNYVPKNIKSFEKIDFENLDSFQPDLSNQEASDSAHEFNYVATILYGLEKVNHVFTKILNIWIVGAEQEEFAFRTLHCYYLAAQVTQVQLIKLYFIGPELEPHETHATFFIHDVRVEKIFYKDSIQNVIRRTSNEKLLAPDIIVCFNCGFHEKDGTSENNWRNGIKSMLTLLRVPILFTSFTKHEAIEDMNVMKDCAKDAGVSLNVLLDSQSNPFRDVYPLRNTILDDEEIFYFINNYVHLVVNKN